MSAPTGIDHWEVALRRIAQIRSTRRRAYFPDIGRVPRITRTAVDSQYARLVNRLDDVDARTTRLLAVLDGVEWGEAVVIAEEFYLSLIVAGIPNKWKWVHFLRTFIYVARQVWRDAGGEAVDPKDEPWPKDEER